MVANYSDFTKLAHAKQIAKDHGYFIVEKPGYFLLYRKDMPKNKFVGKRSSVATIHQLVKKACGVK